MVAGLRPGTLSKKRLWHRCFPANFSKFLRTPFLQNTSGVTAFLYTGLMTVHMKYFGYFEKNEKHIIPYTALILPQFWEYCWISTKVQRQKNAIVKVYHIGNFLVFLANFFCPNVLWLYQHFYLLQQNEAAVNEIIVLETVLSVKSEVAH